MSRDERVGFEEFVAVRGDRLLRTCFLLTRDWALAEDLLQTALAKAWGAWDRIDGEPEPYVRAVAANTYTSWWRRRWTHERPTDAVHDDRALAGPQAALFGVAADRDAASDVDERDRMWAVLGRLPRRQRAVVVLRYYEDLTEAQTAQALGISVGTVKSQTSKAFAAMRLDPALEADAARSAESEGAAR